METADSRTPMEPRQLTRGERPHPTSLTLGHLPRRGRLRRWKRQIRASRIAATSSGAPGVTSSDLAALGHLPRRGRHCAPTYPTGSRAAQGGNDLIRPRCARPPSPEGKAAAALSARVGNGRFRVLQGHYLIRHILRRQQARPHSTFAALGHLPKKGMAAAALFAHTPKKTANSEAFNRLRQPGKPPGARLLQAGSSPCEPGIIPGSFSCPCGRKSVRVRVALWRKLCYTVHAPSRRGRR